MTHSDMLYQLYIKFTCYFYEPLLFQISVPWKFIKTLAFPCLIPLLHSTATQITIPINIFICLNIMQYEISFFNKIHVKVLTKVFYIQIWFKYETLLLFFLIRTMVYRKKLFIEKKNSFFVVGYVKIIKLHIVHK